MGNTPSTEETAKKLARSRALTLPVGSKVEQLFYEDFDTSSSDTPETTPKPIASSSKKKRNRFSAIQPSSYSQDKWAPVDAPTGFSDSAHLSKQAQLQQRPLHNVPNKPLPVVPPIGPGPDFFLSPLDALSRSSSAATNTSSPSSSSKKHDSGTGVVDVAEREVMAEKEAVEAKPKVSNETTPSSTTYSAAESRWQERISKRIADRKISDGVKAGLERTAYMGTSLSEREEVRRE